MKLNLKRCLMLTLALMILFGGAVSFAEEDAPDVAHSIESTNVKPDPTPEPTSKADSDERIEDRSTGDQAMNEQPSEDKSPVERVEEQLPEANLPVEELPIEDQPIEESASFAPDDANYVGIIEDRLDEDRLIEEQPPEEQPPEGQPTEEQDEEELPIEELPVEDQSAEDAPVVERSVYVKRIMPDILRDGDLFRIEAVMIGFDDVEYELKWQYNDGEGWQDMPDERGLTVSLAANRYNVNYDWRILVNII